MKDDFLVVHSVEASNESGTVFIFLMEGCQSREDGLSVGEERSQP